MDLPIAKLIVSSFCEGYERQAKKEEQNDEKMLKKLRYRDKRYKRLKRRTERFHRHIVSSAYAEYYETEED